MTADYIWSCTVGVVEMRSQLILPAFRNVFDPRLIVMVGEPVVGAM